jgi:hypothetical protein
MPDKWPYVNLFPYRVSPAMLGTSDYDSYVRMLVKTIGQPFLSYDNYSLVNGEMLDSFYTNLEIIRRLGLETKTRFWNCILANSHFNYMEPSDATFNLQVYSTMAYRVSVAESAATRALIFRRDVLRCGKKLERS